MKDVMFAKSLVVVSIFSTCLSGVNQMSLATQNMNSLVLPEFCEHWTCNCNGFPFLLLMTFHFSCATVLWQLKILLSGKIEW